MRRKNKALISNQVITKIADELVSVCVTTSYAIEMMDRTPADFSTDYTLKAIRELLCEINSISFDLVLSCGDPTKVLPSGASIFKNGSGLTLKPEA